MKSAHYIRAGMKFASVRWVLFVLLAAGLHLRAAGPDDSYLEAYKLIQEADQLFGGSQSELARSRYAQAEEFLKRLQTSYPNYSRQAVEFRLEYIREKMRGLPSGSKPAESPAPAARPAPAANPLAEMTQRVAQLEANNQLLQAKLQEALAPRPAAMDPAELVKAQVQLKQLEKEKELLRAGLEQAQAKQPSAGAEAMLEQTRAELESTRQKLVENIGHIAALSRENQELRQPAAKAPAPAAIPEAPAKPAENARFKDLEKERDALLKKLNEANKERLKSGYEKLLELGRQVASQATKVCDRLAGRVREKLRVVGKPLKVEAAQAALERFVPLVRRVIAQAKERVFEGNNHVTSKLLSLFETHTAAIKKGKAHKPTEFGQLVRIDEVEAGIVSHYEVNAGNPADVDAWEPAIFQHVLQYGSAPDLATADRGYFSANNETFARDVGVKKVAIPARGPLSTKRTAIQKQRWFRRAMRWRAGVESRIGTLKHVFDMARARYKGADGFERHVGWSVIANNLVSLARGLVKRKRQEEQRDKDNG